MFHSAERWKVGERLRATAVGDLERLFKRSLYVNTDLKAQLCKHWSAFVCFILNRMIR